MALSVRLFRPVLLLSILLFAPILHSEAASRSVAEEDFSEELLLRPLPDRKVLAHFHFRSRAPHASSNGRPHRLFPKAISQLVQKFHVKEMELSFTQGRWNYDRWGGFDPITSNNAKPPGVELWAVFEVPPEQVDDSWKGLTHALSGLFCASINFLESSTTYSAPEWGYRPASSNLRYGTLPREAVCTENLTPWMKLLPCRDKTGISALMDRPSIYRGFYHSQQLRFTSSELESEEVGSGIALHQTLTVVLQPDTHRSVMTDSHDTKLQPSWSLTSIFGRKVTGKCELSKSSTVYLQLDRGLAAQLDYLQKENDISTIDESVSEVFWSNPGFELSVKPDRVLKELNGFEKKNPSVLYEFSIENSSESRPFDLGLNWKLPVLWSCQKAPLHASRFLMGSGNERGAIAILLRSTEVSDGLLRTDVSEGRCKLEVKIFQVVPWYIKVYYHTMQVFVNEQPQAVSDVVEKMRVAPSIDKVSPGVIEMHLKFPCGMKSAAVTIEFDKGFLHIDEYPPDANQGFDIPAAIISFLNFNTSMQFFEDNSVEESAILSKFQDNSAVLAYTEVLLVPLTTPDFSMPYNVITITCTVCALYFGSLLNALRERFPKEERSSKSKAAKDTSRRHQLLSRLSVKLIGRPLEIRWRLLVLILVVGIAFFWQAYFG